MELNLERLRSNVRRASDEDLLDRVTVYRAEMEPAAIPIIEQELFARGITVDLVEAHLAKRENAQKRADGTVLKCTLCHRPAVVSGWGWHRMFGIVPVFPRRFSWCDEHQSKTSK